MAKNPTKPTKPPAPKPFWDVQNRLNKLIVTGSAGQATITIQPKWKNAGGPLHVAIDAKGLKAIAKDLSRQGTDPAYVRCTDAPKSRRCYVSSGDVEKVACYFSIVDKTGGKKAERHLRVALGPTQQARLLDALIAYGG